MLCPSCGQNVGETMQLCGSCAEVKRQEDARKQAEAAAREAEAAAAAEQASTSEATSTTGKPAAAQNLSELDDETRFLLVKALAAALVVLVILLVLLVILT